MRQLDKIIADPGGIEDIQVKAMALLIRCVDICYGIVRDVEVEQLEREYEKIKEENRRAREDQGEKDLGYDIETDEEEPTKRPS